MGYIEDMRNLVGNHPLILIGSHAIILNEKMKYYCSFGQILTDGALWGCLRI